MRQAFALTFVIVALLMASGANALGVCPGEQWFDGQVCQDPTHCAGTVARYVRIFQTSLVISLNDPEVASLNLNEIEVYSNGVNVARAPTTAISMSSTRSGATAAANCVDGARTGGTVCGTLRAADDSNNHQWIELDLGSAMPIQSIELYNDDTGAAGAAGRIETAELRLLDAARTNVHTRQLLAGAHNVYFTNLEFEVSPPSANANRVCQALTTCTVEQYASTQPSNTTNRVCDTLTECNGQIRFVRILNTESAATGSDPHRDVINLREIEIFQNGVNIAREASSSITMSTVFGPGLGGENCVDGITTNDGINLCVTGNTGPAHQWIEIDLGGLRSIDSIVIWNRNDGAAIWRTRTEACELRLLGQNREQIHVRSLTDAALQVYDGFTAQFSAPLAQNPTADRQCSNVTTCDPATQWTSTVPTATSDAQCSNLTACNSTEFVSTAATWNADRVCSPWSDCTAQQYQVSEPNATHDRGCAGLTACGVDEVEVVAPTATSDRQCSSCNCANALTADYKNTLAPDAGKEAYTTIELNTNTWEVEFKIHNVLSMTNGHIIAAPIEARTDVATAISSLVSNYNTSELWNPPRCGLSALDVPAAGLGVAVDFQGSTTACYRSFTIRYSLTDAAQRTSHCELVNTADNEIRVECKFEMNTIRAYDLTAPTAFLAKETVFRANITMPRTLPSELETLLHASLAKCSVYAAPDFLIDCRIPALWNFAPAFSVTQSPSWIDDSSCVQTNGTDATYIRCDLNSISQIYTEATATIGATVLPSGELMRFNVNYSLPREETASATGSLATFVKSIGTKDGKFFYGNDDLLTLEIEVVETARLEIVQLELFNSDSPVQVYDLRGTPQFELQETSNATFFVITFYPARVLSDSNFYRHGPHGVNVSFQFTAAARRRQDAAEGDKGTVTYSGIALQGPKSSTPAGQSATGTSTGSSVSQTAIAAIAAGALVAVVAVVAGVVVVVRKGRQAAAAAAPKTAAAASACADADELPCEASAAPGDAEDLSSIQIVVAEDEV